MISRRALLSMSAPIVALAFLPLAACTGFVSKVAKDVDLIAQGVEAVLPTIEKLIDLPAAVKDKVVAIVGEIKSVASNISRSVAVGTVDLVKQLGAAVANIANTLGGIKIPSWVSTVIKAAVALIPSIESAVGIVTPAARFVEMTPEQARAVLGAAAR